MALLFSSCALIMDPIENNIAPIKKYEEPEVVVLFTDLAKIGEPVRKPVIAVYPNAFKDETGQRRSNSQYATFSTAITQAPHAYLIRVLKHSEFFDVVERVALEAVSKERQLIRSTRETFDVDQKLMPLTFADQLITGGVLSYQANISSGGQGARFLGLGGDKSYREDIITISLRLVSVSTGRVLIETLVTKKVLSASLNNDVFRFISDNTELLELEGGVVKNEPMSVALQMAIETAVKEIIEQGLEKDFWRYKQ
jgi:curli production assembly/transport component CsgG